jgi:hypothetical protein
MDSSCEVARLGCLTPRLAAMAITRQVVGWPRGKKIATVCRPANELTSFLFLITLSPTRLACNFQILAQQSCPRADHFLPHFWSIFISDEIPARASVTDHFWIRVRVHFRYQCKIHPFAQQPPERDELPLWWVSMIRRLRPAPPSPHASLASIS